MDKQDDIKFKKCFLTIRLKSKIKYIFNVLFIEFIYNKWNIVGISSFLGKDLKYQFLKWTIVLIGIALILI